ncbi:hypothetical protein QT821_22555, partial [Xanthomonas citri pv. citri]
SDDVPVSLVLATLSAIGDFKLLRRRRLDPRTTPFFNKSPYSDPPPFEPLRSSPAATNLAPIRFNMVTVKSSDRHRPKLT